MGGQFHLKVVLWILIIAKSVFCKMASRQGRISVFIVLTFFVLVLLCFFSSQSKSGQIGLENVCFSPKEKCTDMIVEKIEKTRRSLLIQAYSFTSPAIAQAVAQAHKKGILVAIILDKSQESVKYSVADYLFNQGVPVWIDRTHAIAHNKIMIFDEDAVLTGSFNFTRAAQDRNAENIVILKDRDLALRYADNWRSHAAHAVAYEGALAKR